jgi:hypothetical protein
MRFRCRVLVIAKSFICNVFFSAYPRTSHVVSGEGKRTLNLLKGLLQGCWLVTKVLVYTVQFVSAGPCCGSGIFYPGSGSDHFLIPDPNPNIFSSRILHEKWNENLTFFLLLMLSGAKP